MIRILKIILGVIAIWFIGSAFIYQNQVVNVYNHAYEKKECVFVHNTVWWTTKRYKLCYIEDIK